MISKFISADYESTLSTFQAPTYPSHALGRGVLADVLLKHRPLSLEYFKGTGLGVANNGKCQ